MCKGFFSFLNLSFLGSLFIPMHGKYHFSPCLDYRNVNKLIHFRFLYIQFYMDLIKTYITYKCYTGIDALPQEDKTLMEAAMKAAHTAYAPYSRFFVGAAVRLENGSIVLGSNQENAAYPSGLCAERVALFSVGAHHPQTSVTAIAVTAFIGDLNHLHPVSPCGGCRQVMSEFEHRYSKPIKMIMMAEQGKIIVLDSVRDLLPFTFNSDSMKTT
jgi:cytidine deaminase